MGSSHQPPQVRSPSLGGEILLTDRFISLHFARHDRQPDPHVPPIRVSSRQPRAPIVSKLYPVRRASCRRPARVWLLVGLPDKSGTRLSVLVVGASMLPGVPINGCYTCCHSGADANQTDEPQLLQRFSSVCAVVAHVGGINDLKSQQSIKIFINDCIHPIHSILQSYSVSSPTGTPKCMTTIHIHIRSLFRFQHSPAPRKVTTPYDSAPYDPLQVPR